MTHSFAHPPGILWQKSVLRALRCLLVLGTCLLAITALAQDVNLLPKYGLQKKTEAQQAADAQFLASIDSAFNGDRKKAAAEASRRGWLAYRQGDAAQAMRRFNQAWLLDKTNGAAIWGMATIMSDRQEIAAAQTLFAEAQTLIGPDIDFAVDHARFISMVAARTRNTEMLKDAMARFARNHEQAPQHTLNLQNWAIAFFSIGDFAEAWRKIKLAQATPRHAELDPRFIAALQSKMPRPPDR